MTSSVPTDVASSLRGLLNPLFPDEWTAESFARAPDLVRELEERCGELRPGQLLMTGRAVAAMVPFAMWWPWGDGSKVSVRIGIAKSDRPKELYPQMRALFGIA